MNRPPRPGVAALASRPDLGWQDGAACEGEPELFFAPAVPDGAGLAELAALVAERKRRESAARLICASCPVRAACLERGLRLEHQLDEGIWGGKDERERWKIRQRRIRASAARKRAA